MSVDAGTPVQTLEYGVHTVTAADYVMQSFEFDITSLLWTVDWTWSHGSW